MSAKKQQQVTWQSRDYKGELQLMAVQGAECEAWLQHDVRLIRQSGRRFAVGYGLEVHEGLTYDQAAIKVGFSIMHALSCDGRLPNWRAIE